MPVLTRRWPLSRRAITPPPLKELRPLAEKGDARSQYAMGVMAENGFGMPKNLSQAAAWYLKAAKQGNSDAQYNLGAMYEHGIGMPANPSQAARWYRPAAEAGDIDALSNLGVLYEKGQGVPQDKVLAMALYNVSVAYDSNKQQPARRATARGWQTACRWKTSSRRWR